MSAPRNDVDEADRLARVKLSCTIEPGDLRVTGLVSELRASKVLGYLEDRCGSAVKAAPGKAGRSGTP